MGGGKGGDGIGTMSRWMVERGREARGEGGRARPRTDNTDVESPHVARTGHSCNGSSPSAGTTPPCRRTVAACRTHRQDDRRSPCWHRLCLCAGPVPRGCTTSALPGMPFYAPHTHRTQTARAPSASAPVNLVTTDTGGHSPGHDKQQHAGVERRFDKTPWA